MSRTYKDTKKGKERIARKHGMVWENEGMWWYIGGISSWFKKLRRQGRRAKERQALLEGRDIPRFRKDDYWDWWDW